MNTYTINKDKVKICLSDDEVNTLFGGYDNIDYDCPRSRAVLDSLLMSALPESMLPLDCKKVLIEVSEERAGCSIQITRIYDKGKRMRRLGGIQKYILLFNGSEDMINFITNSKEETLLSLKSAKLIKAGEGYCLFFTSRIPFSELLPVFSEYGRLTEQKTALGAALLEYGSVICDNATEKLLSAFKKS